MPSSEVRLGLLNADSKICGELILKNSSIFHRKTEKDRWELLKEMPIFDKLIQFSPFEDSKGRLLKEGDVLQTKSGMTKMTLSLVDGVWLVDVKGDKIQLYSSGAKALEYTGNIFLEH